MPISNQPISNQRVSTHPGHRSARNRRRAGGAMVESAFVFVVMFSMLVGAFDFANFLFVHQAVEERIRWGIRNGLVLGQTNLTANIENLILHGHPDSVQNGNHPGWPRYYDMSHDEITVVTADAGTDNYRVIVQLVSFDFVSLSPFMAGGKTTPTITVVYPLGMFYS